MAILITAASFSLAYKLEQSLNESEVYFAEHIEMPSIPGKKFIRIPEASSPIFTSELLKICIDNQIVKIYPLKEAEIKELSKAKQLFIEYGINIIIPSNEWIL
ncbi:hypothetical protein [Daejeonella sp.]|uniref:hypothetical protein n=1 Tax=Daejeonella sp. TaxID=2805397 RepID=UPI00272F5695|nr:hypothetical protein [Daejeonella sp.]MDP2413697.1 hypothetical protein [Daejeonella sp.]